MAKRAILVLVAVALIAAGVVGYILVSHTTAPSLVKLLPPADAYIYFDAAIVRRSAVFTTLPKVEFDPEYAAFVSQTGFNLEKDLDEAAFALQHQTTPVPANVQAPEWRNTGVFTASFDRPKVETYLRGVSQSTETYRNTTIYSVALPGRTLRIAILDARTVAASNTDGPYVIQGIIDRHAQFAGSAPALVHDYYRRLPWGSLAWAIARPPKSGTGTAQLELPAGSLTVPAGTVVLASVRFLGSIDLQAQAFAPTEEDARQMADQINAFLTILHTFESEQARGSDADVKSLFDSLHVTLNGNRAVLDATVPEGFLKKLVANTPAAGLDVQPAATPAPSPPAPAATRSNPRHQVTTKGPKK